MARDSPWQGTAPGTTARTTVVAGPPWASHLHAGRGPVPFGLSLKGWTRINPGIHPGVDAPEPRFPDTGVMTFSDYLIDFALIGLVLLQVRGRRLTTRALVLPLGIVAYVANQYLHGVPTAHNDLVLVGALTVVGATLGGLAGRFTSVTRAADGSIMAKAGVTAAGLWILGTGGRLVFQLYATHGGGPSIMRFSAAHGITSPETWTAALILMALSEVVMRTAVLAWRSHALRQGAPVAAATAAPAPSGLLRTIRAGSEVPSLRGEWSMMDSGDRAL